MQAIYRAESRKDFEKLADRIKNVFDTRDYDYIGDHRIVATAHLIDHVKFVNSLDGSDIRYRFRLI